MWRTMLGLFVLAHGVVTVAIWGPNPRTVEKGPPIDTSHSWLLGSARSVSLILAIWAGVAISVAGIAFLTHQEWWPLAGILGGGLSFILFIVFFSPWWFAAIAISAGLIAASVRAGIHV